MENYQFNTTYLTNKDIGEMHGRISQVSLDKLRAIYEIQDINDRVAEMLKLLGEDLNLHTLLAACKLPIFSLANDLFAAECGFGENINFIPVNAFENYRDSFGPGKKRGLDLYEYVKELYKSFILKSTSAPGMEKFHLIADIILTYKRHELISAIDLGIDMIAVFIKSLKIIHRYQATHTELKEAFARSLPALYTFTTLNSSGTGAGSIVADILFDDHHEVKETQIREVGFLNHSSDFALYQLETLREFLNEDPSFDTAYYNDLIHRIATNFSAQEREEYRDYMLGRCTYAYSKSLFEVNGEERVYGFGEQANENTELSLRHVYYDESNAVKVRRTEKPISVRGSDGKMITIPKGKPTFLVRQCLRSREADVEFLAEVEPSKITTHCLGMRTLQGKQYHADLMIDGAESNSIILIAMYLIALMTGKFNDIAEPLALAKESQREKKLSRYRSEG